MPTNVAGANQTKRKILEILRFKGPSLPVQIASQTGISPLFAGAFLSELAKEQAIKISNMKVGGSPLYFLKGQEPVLEKFYTYLPGKEKQAFLLLKQKKILKDNKQEPSIRVALRSLKDFAIPFHDDNELFWRFHSTSEQEVREMFERKLKTVKKEEKPQKIIKETEKPKEKIEQQLDIGLLPVKEKTKIEKRKIIVRKRKTGSFLEKVISFLTARNIELINIEKSTPKEVYMKVKENDRVYLLYAINKRKISESDLIKAYKKASELNLPYFILGKNEPSKKLKETITASKTLTKIDKFE